LNSFQQLIFDQQSAALLKVPPQPPAPPCYATAQDISWDRPSDRKFHNGLVCNHKYAEIGRSFKMLV